MRGWRINERTEHIIGGGRFEDTLGPGYSS